MNITPLTTKFGVKTTSYYKRRLGRRQVGMGLVRKPISSFLSFISVPEDLPRKAVMHRPSELSHVVGSSFTDHRP